MERKSLDLNEIFIAVADNFKLQLEEKNMKLEYISKGECCIMANPTIDAIFSNLLSNAIKYLPAGRKIEVNIIDEREHCKIYVKDWGYGIKDEDKAKLFTRFQRVEKKGVKGSGLGLAIVKRVVDLHGGKIWIEDNLPSLPRGIWARIFSIVSLGTDFSISVSINPGTTALMVIPLPASSFSSVWDKAINPAFEAT